MDALRALLPAAAAALTVGGAAAADPVSVRFDCDGRIADVAFVDPETARLTVDDETWELRRRPTASGARYAIEDESVAVWDRGDVALVTLGGEDLPECVKMADLTESAADKPGDEGAAPAAAPLLGPEWVVEDIDSRGVVDNSRATLEFRLDGGVGGRASCNRYRGTYEAGDGTVSFSANMAVTMMACPPALMEQEARFLEALKAADRWRIDETGALILEGADDRRILARR